MEEPVRKAGPAKRVRERTVDAIVDKAQVQRRNEGWRCVDSFGAA